MHFRDDIQILRALAVIAVVLYHLKVPGFASGFLGVDLFFVISGFLMERLYDPSKGALAFYRRRARRLLPAYYVTILVTLIAAFFITIPPEFNQVGEQAVYAAFFGSNIGFWTHEGYFNKFDFSPLLHLWSLGVELQFYLIVPLILWVRSKVGAWFIPALILVSMMVCAALVMINPKSAFLLMPARIWEFGLGMWAAQLGKGVARNQRIGLGAIVAILILMFVPVSGDIKDVLRGHPGAGAMAMCAATALALWGGLPQSLCIAPFKKLGDWSYSIYLAHFPVIILGNYEPFSGTNLGGVYWLPLIALASYLLYNWIERGHLYNNRRAILASGTLAVLGFVSVPVQATRFTQQDRLIFAAMEDRGPFRCGKLFRFIHPGEKMCRLSSGPKGDVLLIGDSRADSIKQTFVEVAQSHGYGVRFALDNDPLISSGYGPEWLSSEAKSAKGIFYHYTPGNYRKAVRPNVDLPTALIPFTPEFNAELPKAMYEARHAQRPLPIPQQPDYPPYCKPLCAYESDGRPLYFDKHHLTLTGARHYKPVFEEIFRKTLP